MITHINMRSRIANKVYYPPATQRDVLTFDDMFDIIHSIDRSLYVPKLTGIVVRIHTRQSTLHAERTVQSIAHKAIITKLT